MELGVTWSIRQNCSKTPSLLSVKSHDANQVDKMIIDLFAASHEHHGNITGTMGWKGCRKGRKTKPLHQSCYYQLAVFQIIQVTIIPTDFLFITTNSHRNTCSVGTGRILEHALSMKQGLPLWLLFYDWWYLSISVLPYKRADTWQFSTLGPSIWYDFQLGYGHFSN